MKEIPLHEFTNKSYGLQKKFSKLFEDILDNEEEGIDIGLIFSAVAFSMVATLRNYYPHATVNASLDIFVKMLMKAKQTMLDEKQNKTVN